MTINKEIAQRFDNGWQRQTVETIIEAHNSLVQRVEKLEPAQLSLPTHEAHTHWCCIASSHNYCCDAVCGMPCPACPDESHQTPKVDNDICACDKPWFAIGSRKCQGCKLQHRAG